MKRNERNLKVKPWRRRLRRLFFLAVLALILTSASVPQGKEFDLFLSPIIAGQRFDWVGWETDVLIEEANWWTRGRRLTGDRAQVLVFLEQQWQIAELEDRTRREVAQLPQAGPASPFEESSTLASLEGELDALQQKQRANAPQTERILAAQVSQVLVDEGLGVNDLAWPPVTFRFNDLPTYLVISPQDEIRVYRGIHLLPDISEAERSHLEAAIEARLDVSALIVDVGGIGSWPTMVIDTASLRSVLDIIAHEWTHTYLLLRPLGLRYSDSRDLTTMNETVASIVGGEIADMVIALYYPELVPPPAATPQPPPEANRSPQEDFNQAMRRIRLHVDELLAEGKVSEAGAYMEAERQKLVAMGYDLRRLNQAYFAFHGSYATSPASVDPIGPWLRQLRAQSGSLKAFVDQVGHMRSLDDLLRALDEKGLQSQSGASGRK